MRLTSAFSQVPRALDETIARQQGVLDPLAENVQRRLRGAVEQGGPIARAIKDVLHGIWLGHALHPALTDVPIGAYSLGMLLDLGSAREAADRAITVGVVSSVPTALAGLADWTDTEDKQRRIGLVHALLNTVALGFFVTSLVMRRKDHRVFGLGLSTAGFALAVSSAYLGGELVFRRGTAVSRAAWSPEIDEFQVAAKEGDLVEGQAVRGEVTVAGEKVPLVLVKSGDRVFALHDVCSHWGASLAGGRLVMGGEAIECPWHRSTFRLDSGTAVHGPAAVPQPCFETRVRDGDIEVRRVGPQ